MFGALSVFLLSYGAASRTADGPALVHPTKPGAFCGGAAAFGNWTEPLVLLASAPADSNRRVAVRISAYFYSFVLVRPAFTPFPDKPAALPFAAFTAGVKHA